MRPGDQVVQGDLLVPLVGEHVLLVEASGRSAEPEPLEGCLVAAHRPDAAHLEEREVPHERAAPATMEPEERHEVARAEREARATGRGRRRRSASRSSASITSAKRLAWTSAGRPSPYSPCWMSTSAALARPVRRGMPQRVRIGFLELVGGAVHGELAHLREAYRTRPCSRRATARRHSTPGAAAPRRRASRRHADRAPVPRPRPSRRSSVVLQPSPLAQQRRLPLPRLVHVREAEVVELVAEVEGEREVVVDERVAITERQLADLVHRPAQVVEQLPATPGPREASREARTDRIGVVRRGDEQGHRTVTSRPRGVQPTCEDRLGPLGELLVLLGQLLEEVGQLVIPPSRASSAKCW